MTVDRRIVIGFVGLLVVGIGIVALHPVVSEGPQNESQPPNDQSEGPRTEVQTQTVQTEDPINVSDMELMIELGGPDEWDAGAVSTVTVVRAGETWHLYYEGSPPESELPEASFPRLWKIGHATSQDGVDWEKSGDDPVLPEGDDGAWDAGGVWDPVVLYDVEGKDRFHMWYGGQGNRTVNRTYDIGYAVSDDGTNWDRNGRISDFNDSSHYRLDVVHHDGLYHLYVGEEGGGILHFEAESPTGFDFENPDVVRIGSENVSGHPYVFTEEGRTYMTYGGGQEPIQYAMSNDSWTGFERRGTLFEGTEYGRVGDRGVMKRVNDTAYHLYFGVGSAEGADMTTIGRTAIHGERTPTTGTPLANASD